MNTSTVSMSELKESMQNLEKIKKESKAEQMTTTSSTLVFVDSEDEEAVQDETETGMPYMLEIIEEVNSKKTNLAQK